MVLSVEEMLTCWSCTGDGSMFVSCLSLLFMVANIIALRVTDVCCTFLCNTPSYNTMFFFIVWSASARVVDSASS